MWRVENAQKCVNILCVYDGFDLSDTPQGSMDVFLCEIDLFLKSTYCFLCSALLARESRSFNLSIMQVFWNISLFSLPHSWAWRLVLTFPPSGTRYRIPLLRVTLLSGSIWFCVLVECQIDITSFALLPFSEAGFFWGGGFGKNCLLPFTASSCNWSIFIVYHFNCRDITLKEYSCSFQLTPYLQ